MLFVGWEKWGEDAFTQANRKKYFFPQKGGSFKCLYLKVQALSDQHFLKHSNQNLIVIFCPNIIISRSDMLIFLSKNIDYLFELINAFVAHLDNPIILDILR